MANTNSPFGFRPVKLRGTDPQYNIFAPKGYSIASAYGTSIFSGDPVKSSGTASADGRPGIVIGTNGPIRGIFAGVTYTDANGDTQYRPYWLAATVATNIIAHVYDDPQTVFSVQASGAFAVTDVGNKADFVSGSGSAATGISAYALDSTTIAAQDSLLILGADPVEGNEVGTYSKLHVLIREHELLSTYTAV